MKDQIIILLTNIDVHLIITVAAGVLLALTIRWVFFTTYKTLLHLTSYACYNLIHHFDLLRFFRFLARKKSFQSKGDF
jgi:hypothetical protein